MKSLIFACIQPSARWWLFLILLAFSSFSDAGEIKAILLCDTRAQNLEKSVSSDLKNWQAELQRISKGTGLPLVLYTFTNEKAGKPFVEALKEITIHEDDVVFFYFSGHGFRTNSKSGNQWPNLYLTSDKIGIDFYAVFQSLSAKKPRLLIALSDCCNNVLPEKSAPPVVPIHAYKHLKPISYQQANYKRLFLKTKGTILIGSSIPGEFSWGTESGGLYTLALLRFLIEDVNSPKPADWHVLLDKAAKQVVSRNLGQTPQYELNISLD
ncbi:caspase family protein [Estrella lausannensis]|uniref:Putative caspase n=1 Tax=Estrella lausannensis TaxID=483423 RepID=A0A0H5DN22_9BACT|nr:caspase family protein [Estrella lausannensis]CRX37611.1 Putative caspase [Estrella lausannensis]